jgi:phosphomannomutase/phosphoglucomutase
MKSHIFREYDIRGVVPEDLNEETVHTLGLAMGTYYRDRRVHRICMGRDCRISSPMLARALARGLTESGIHVIDVGMVATPLLYFCLYHFNLAGGVQITGSHNPPDFNGIKICFNKTTIHGHEIEVIRDMAERGVFARGKGRVERADVSPAYADYLEHNIRPGQVNIKAVVDGGNGAGGSAASEIYQRMGFEVIPVFCDPDGRFPNHHPDPSVPENLNHLILKVKEASADVGMAFDGDADRLGVVDHEGHIIPGDQLLLLFAQDVLKRHPGGTVIGEVKCSQVLFDEIEKSGGKAVMWKAGHSLIKSKMKDENAVLAGEITGHYCFADRYFGYDDAIYAGARLMEILSRKEKTLKEYVHSIPHKVSTPEIRTDCPDERKFKVVEQMVGLFKDRGFDVNDLDGARVRFHDGWGLLRASNTQPALVLRFEAETRERLDEIRNMFMTELNKRLRCSSSVVSGQSFVDVPGWFG